VEFNSDINAGLRPNFITTSIEPARYRYRLTEMREPSDQLSIYNYTSELGGTSGILNCTLYNSYSANGMNWFTTPLNAVNSQGFPADRRVLAENIVALVLLPMLSPQDDPTGTALCPNYTYDSSLTDANNDPMVSGSTNWKNQLPPVIQVTMVAVDEISFKRLQSGTSPPANLAGDSPAASLFLTAGANIYTSSAQHPGYAQDLAALEAALQADKLNYRVFSTEVIIKGAKWSRAETQ
jgi:uncharacterized protein (TIGR02599 family)